MANKTWKAFERTDFFVRAKVALKRLVGRELRLRPEIRLKTREQSDWWFAPELLGHEPIVYSLGVGEDTAFDESLIRNYGAQVFAFDPTPNTVDWLASRELPVAFRFHPWAVTATDGTLTLYPRSTHKDVASPDMMTTIAGAGTREGSIMVPSYCLDTITHKLGHDHIDLLKMDIEGAEYEVLDSLLDSNVRPKQLMVEFHHRFFPDGLEKTAGVVARLADSGYKIFAISINGREVSFVHAP